MTSAGDAFDYMTHVTTSVARVCLPDYDDTQTSGELVANVIHGGGGAFLQMDGETTAQFSHAIRPALYRYDYARKAVVAPATFGDASQGYTGLSPFTDWIIDFNFTQGSDQQLHRLLQADAGGAGIRRPVSGAGSPVGGGCAPGLTRPIRDVIAAASDACGMRTAVPGSPQA